MVGYFVAGGRELGQRFVVRLNGRVLTDDKKCDFQIALFEKIEDARHNDIDIRGEGFPARIAMGLHIRPFIVQVERKARDRFHRIYRDNRIVQSGTKKTK